MRRIALLLCAAASLLAQRPRYGGTLTVETRARAAKLEPDADGVAQSVDLRRLAAAVYEGLVRRDQAGGFVPALAEGWRSRGGSVVLSLRPRLRLHDATPLTAEAVAAALVPRLAGRTVTASGDSVTIQPERGVLSELADPRLAVFATGPFKVASWSPGGGALVANEAHWEGRPFVDRVEVLTGRSLKEQLADFEAARADVVELTPAEMRRQQTQRGRGVWSSAALDVISLVFVRGRPSVQDERVRRGLALTVDRPPIVNVLLQRQGEASGGLLPLWMTGYGFLFPVDRDADRARQLLTPAPPPLVLGYDSADPLLRLVAERIALNVRESGAMLRVSPAETPDAILVRASALSTDPGQALAEYSRALQMPAPVLGAGLESVYQAEKRGLAGGWIAPLFHVPSHYALGGRVRGWVSAATVWWKLEQVWLAQ